MHFRIIPTLSLLSLSIGMINCSATSPITSPSLSPWPSLPPSRSVMINYSYEALIGYHPEVQPFIWDQVCNVHLSCKGRCGRDELDRKTSRCQCDAYCMLYNRCCWDFRTRCPAQVLEYHRLSTQIGYAQVTCVNGVDIINSCGETNEVVEETDPREPILTVDDSLHFRNKNVYNCFFRGHNTTQHRIKYWNRVLQFPNNVSFVRALQSFALFGRKPDSFQIHDSLPVGTDVATLARKCWKGYNVECFFKYKIYQSISGIFFLESNYTSCKEPISKTTVPTTTTTTTRKHGIQTGLVKVGENGLCTVTPEPPDSNILETPTRKIADTDHHVQLTINFQDIHNPILIKNYAQSPMFPNIVFREKYNASLLMNDGYRPIGCKGNTPTVPVGFLCYRPIRAFIKIYGIHSKAKTLETIIQDILFHIVENRDIGLNLPFMWKDESKIKVNGDYVIFTHQLGNYIKDSFNGTRLPLTNSVLEMLRLKGYITNASVHAISLCFKMSPRPFGSNSNVKTLVDMLFCDHLVSLQNGIDFHSHVRVYAGKFPEPLFLSQNREIPLMASGYIIEIQNKPIKVVRVIITTIVLILIVIRHHP